MIYMARTTYKRRNIDVVELYYEVIDLPRKENRKHNRKHIYSKTVAELKAKAGDMYHDNNIIFATDFGNYVVVTKIPTF